MRSCNQVGKVSEFCACLHLCLLSGCDRSGSLARVRVRHFLGRLGRQYVYRKKSPKATSNGTRWFRNCGCSPGFHETEQPISLHNRPKDQTAAGVHVHVQLLCVSLRFTLNVYNSIRSVNRVGSACGPGSSFMGGVGPIIRREEPLPTMHKRNERTFLMCCLVLLHSVLS